MKKLLAIQDSLAGGGAERSNADLWYYLKKQGWEVEVVVFKKAGSGVQEEVLSSGIRVYFILNSSLLNSVSALSKLIKENKPDIVHATLFYASLAARLSKIYHPHFILIESLVNTTYDPVRLMDPNITWFKLKAYQLLDATTAHLFTHHFHAITETVSQHHQQAWWMPSKRITVVPRGRMPNMHRGNAALRERYVNEFGLQPDDFIIITTGRQEFQKGHAHLLRALHLARERGLRFFKYLMLGREGHATLEINRLIDEMELAPHILQLGHRHDVEQILSIGHVFAFPSVYEGLGVSLIEAQAAGLPVLCNDIPVFREVTRPSENAWLIPATDTAAWADALLRLSKESETRQQMGAISLQHFSDTYQLDAVHERMMQFFIQQARP